MRELTYSQAIEKADALKALGETNVYLFRNDEGFPFDKVSRVEAGNTFRLNGPSSCYLIVEEDGLTFRLSIDFEALDANGRGVSLFDADRLRELALKLSDDGRRAFAEMLEKQVLPPLATRTNEIREALRSQSNSEDCVRGIIAFAKQTEAA